MPAPPHEFVIDLGQVEPLTAFSYLPRQDAWTEGNVEHYALYASTDGATWGAPVVTGRFDNIAASNAEQFVPFPTPAPVAARYVKFVALASVRERPWANCAELGLFV